MWQIQWILNGQKIGITIFPHHLIKTTNLRLNLNSTLLDTTEVHSSVNFSFCNDCYKIKSYNQIQGFHHQISQHCCSETTRSVIIEGHTRAHITQHVKWEATTEVTSVQSNTISLQWLMPLIPLVLFFSLQCCVSVWCLIFVEALSERCWIKGPVCRI